MPGSDTRELGVIFPAIAASKKRGEVLCLNTAESTAALAKELVA